MSNSSPRTRDFAQVASGDDFSTPRSVHRLAGAALNAHLLAGRQASGPQVVPKPPSQQHLRIVR